jgi:hypothetical protein
MHMDDCDHLHACCEPARETDFGPMRRFERGGALRDLDRPFRVELR